MRFEQCYEIKGQKKNRTDWEKIHCTEYKNHLDAITHGMRERVKQRENQMYIASPIESRQLK